MFKHLAYYIDISWWGIVCLLVFYHFFKFFIWCNAFWLKSLVIVSVNHCLLVVYIIIKNFSHCREFSDKVIVICAEIANSIHLRIYWCKITVPCINKFLTLSHIFFSLKRCHWNLCYILFCNRIHNYISKLIFWTVAFFILVIMNIHVITIGIFHLYITLCIKSSKDFCADCLIFIHAIICLIHVKHSIIVWCYASLIF